MTLNSNSPQLAIYFCLHVGQFDGKTLQYGKLSPRSMKPRPELRPGLHLVRQSERLPFHLVFLRCATIVSIIGSTVRYTFFAVETAFSMLSMTFNTSQSCCFLFVFLRFIVPPILLCWHGAVFPDVSSPFFAFFALTAKQWGNR